MNKTTNYSSNALFTDFYELTMAQGYWKQKMDEEMLYKRLKYYQSQLTDLEKTEKEEEHNAGDELQ